VTFLEWTFLLGAVAVIGPIAAHLLSKPRFRRVPFTMLRFLRSGQKESHGRRQVRDLLILLLRCAIIVVIAMLFAQPILRVASRPQPHRAIHYIAVDDSASMAYHERDGTLLARAANAAVEYVAGLGEGSVCYVRAPASHRAFDNLTKAQAIATIRQLTASPRNADIEDFLAAVRQARQAASRNDSIHAAVFSDFAPDVLNQLNHVREPAAVDGILYKSIVPADPISNVAIIGAKVKDADPPVLDVTIANVGDKVQQRTLMANGASVTSHAISVNLAPHERHAYQVPLIPRPCLPVELRLSPSDGLAEDDTYRIAVCTPSSAATHILLVGSDDETFLFDAAVRALGNPRYELRKTPEDHVTFSGIEWSDVIVLAAPPTGTACPPADIDAFLNKGGRLICFATRAGASDAGRTFLDRGLLAALPEKWVQTVSYPESAALTLDSLGLEAGAVQSLANYRLDKTAMKGYWSCRTSPQSECLWRFANGTGFMYGKAVGRGLSLFINASIDSSGGLLARSQAWVAFCQCLIGRCDQVKGCCFSTAETATLQLPQARPGAQMWVQNCDGSKVVAKAQGAMLRLPAPTGLGWMKTFDEPPLCVGINLPQGESEIGRSPEDAVADAVKRAFTIEAHHEEDTVFAQAPMRDRPIWRAFAWSAIVLVVLESALANRLKR
jgi:hypothetical protein